MNCMFSAGSTEAYLARLTADYVERLRRKYFCGDGTSSRPNEPVQSLRDKKFRSRQPANKAKDPYIVATLIALAQEQRLHRQHKTSPDAETQPAVAGRTQTLSVAPDCFEVCPHPVTRTHHEAKKANSLPGSGPAAAWRL